MKLILFILTIFLSLASASLAQSVFPEEEEFRGAYRTRAGAFHNDLTINGTYMGTGKNDHIWYQVPGNYDGVTPLPLIVFWHGYGVSGYEPEARMSNLLTELDSRDWIYLSFNGSSQTHFGIEPAETHCTRCIDYLCELAPDGSGSNGVLVDTDRIYMAGFSMGGLGAASYASRFMTKDLTEGYRVSGLILVAPLLDLIHSFDAADPGVLLHVPSKLAGNPTQVPYDWKRYSFFYSQSSQVVPDQSMARNLLHGFSVYLTWCGLDPHTELVQQAEMMEDYFNANSTKVNFFARYYATQPNFPDPIHWWTLLDLQESFNYLTNKSLADQETNEISVLIDGKDNPGAHYWVEADKANGDDFALFEGSLDDTALEVTTADNTTRLSVDGDPQWSLIGAGADEISIIHSPSSAMDLIMAPMYEPTYVVDDAGVLFDSWAYQSVPEVLEFNLTGTAELYASFELYTNCLTVDKNTLVLPGMITFTLTGKENDWAYMFFSFLQQRVLTFQGHSLLLYPYFFTPLMLPFKFGPSGTIVFPVAGQYDASLIGQTLLTQVLVSEDLVNILEVSKMLEILIQ